MVIGSPQQRNVMDPLSFEEAWEYARATFSESAALAGERDVMLCMEPLSSDQTNFITHPDKAVEMVSAVNHPNFQMIWMCVVPRKKG